MSLERIGAQVDQLRKTQSHKRFLPDVETVRTLLHKDELPIVVPEASQLLVIITVQERLAGTAVLRWVCQMIELIESIKSAIKMLNGQFVFSLL